MLKESDTVRALLSNRIKILSYLDSIVNDFHLSEDCYQDVCAAAVSKIDYFEDAEHLLRWSFRTGRNKAIDALRRRNRQPCGLEDTVLKALEGQWQTESTHSSFESDQTYTLKKCLQELTENGRKMVMLRYHEGMKSGKIAALMGRKVETVYRSLGRAHVSLRECMKRQLKKEKV